MQIVKHNIQTEPIAEVISDTIVLSTVQDALDLMADIDYQRMTKMILHEANIHPDFFDLKTRMAGEILQKFVTYSKQLAIVGNFEKYTSKALRDFIYESNNGHHVFFVGSVEEGIERLGG